MKDSFFNNVDGKSLDKYQRLIVVNNSQHILVIAGAGSGKTLTIVGKIKYLIVKRNLLEREILCISFTNEAVNSLKNKLNYKNVDVMTFHKLALTIIKDNNYQFSIIDEHYFEYFVDEYFESYIYNNNLDRYVIDYFDNIRKKITLEELKVYYPKLFQNYKQIIIKFINQIKTHNHGIIDFRSYLKRNRYFEYKTYEKNRSLLIVILNIYLEYTKELRSVNKIDFNDMINIATFLVSKYGINRKYKYIIIDEYQDTSYVRYLLIKAILLKTNAKLMCVGDDFQSIYSFSGCNLDLFVDFSKYFPNSKKLYIKNTYRNSYQLINTSYSFIKKNKYQIRKKLRACFFLYKPIKLVYYDFNKYREKFYQLLEYLYQNNKKNVLILGRYNNDIFKITNDLQYKNMKLRYLTIHKSKGLEEEDVIIIGMYDGIVGFPNKIVNDNIFQLVNKDYETYLYAEERRLFYVALTRAKKNVYILSPQDKESLFINEIKVDCEKLYIK